jgi:hypothetical protein
MLLFLAMINDTPQKSLTVDDLAKLHAASTAAIRSLEVHLEIADNVPIERGRSGSGPLPQVEKHFAVDWAFDGNWEYMKNYNFRGWIPGSSPTLSEDENGASGYRQFMRSNPEKPLVISESDEGGVKAIVSGRREGLSPFHQPIRQYLGMLFFYDSPEGRTSLSLVDLLARANAKSVAKTPERSSLGCYELAVETAVNDFTIFIDPNLSFSPKRVDQRARTSNSVTVTEIHEFEKFENGVCLPKLRTLKANSDNGNYEYVFRFSYLSINRPIDMSKHHVTFPEWTRVSDADKKVVYLWGPDDKPKQTFKSLAEYQNWFSSRRKTTVFGEAVAEGLKEESAWWRSTWFWLAAGSVVVLTSALLVRLRRGRVQAQ